MQVQASDADDGINAEIFYELLQVTDDADAPVEDAIFSLDAESGSLTSMETLDREKSSYYNITVSAKDKVRTSDMGWVIGGARRPRNSRNEEGEEEMIYLLID
jgi:hypothetical protein